MDSLDKKTSLSTAGVVLAGGQGRRMGKLDKGRLTLNSTPLIDIAVKNAVQQVDRVIISTSAQNRYQTLEHAQITDELSGFQGPLAGVSAAMRFLLNTNEPYHWLASFAVDTPYVPADLVQTLKQHTQSMSHPIYPSYEGQGQYAFTLWPLALADDLDDFLRTGQRSIKHAIKALGGQAINISSPNNQVHNNRALPPFFNINTPEDLNLYQDSHKNLAPKPQK